MARRGEGMKDLDEYFRLGPAERLHEAADFLDDDEDDATATVRNELKRHGVFFNDEEESMSEVDTFAVPEGASVPDEAFDYDTDLPESEEAWDAFWAEWGEDLPEEW